MKGGARWLTACVPVLACLACEGEVTIHLLSDGSDATVAEAATDAPAEANPPGDADAADDEAAIEAQGASPIPCLIPSSCEAGDEDCDASPDFVDGGCGYGILWAPQPDGSFLGHDAGGVMFFEPCPAGAVLTGMTVGMGNWLNQVSAVCRPIELQPDPTLTPLPVAVTLGARIDTPYAPAASTDTTNKVQDLLCPDGMTLTGVDGTTETDSAYRRILGILITCAPPVLVATPNGVVLDTDRTQAQTSGPIVCGSCDASQAYNYSATAPTGQVTTSLFGGDGLWVNRVGFGTSIGKIVSD